ncbi:MAG: hypothetical protein ACLFQJ_06380 [Campylobacterales bacterium]
MNISSLNAQESIVPAMRNSVSSEIKGSKEVAEIAQTDADMSTTKSDRVSISEQSPTPPVVEDFSEINDNEIKPNAQALEHMSSAEAGQFGSGMIEQKEIDTMKSIAMSTYMEHLEEMDLPSNQVPNANGDNFVDTDVTFQNGGFGDINVTNINININEGQNGDKVSPLAGKTEQTGLAE